MLFFAISVALVGLLYGYAGWRLIGPARLPLPLALLAWGLLAFLAALPHAYLFILRPAGLPAWLRDALGWLTYLGLGFVTLAFSLVLLRDLGWLAWSGLERLVTFLRPAAEASSPGLGALASPERREALLRGSGLAVLALSGGLAGLGLWQARRRPRAEQVLVPIAGLPPELEGYRIAQVTDLHVGPTIKRAFVEAVVEAVNRFDADAVVFTGDLADGTVAELAGDVAPLAGLRARDGRYFVTGNHEYYGELEPWLQEVRRLGFDLLLNEHRVLSRGRARLVLAGVTDLSGGDLRPDHASDPAAALAGAPAGAPRVLLAHQPRSALAAARAGCDLVLSGHTHGGQFAPWKYLIPLQQPYVSGLHRVDASTWIYVSRGAGYWGPPVRLLAASEVTCLTLTRA